MNIIKLILTSIITLAFTACSGGGNGNSSSGNTTGQSNTGAQTSGEDESTTGGSSSSTQDNTSGVRLKKHIDKVDSVTNQSITYTYDGNLLVKSVNKQEPVHSNVISEQIIEYKHFKNGKTLRRVTWKEMNQKQYRYIAGNNKILKSSSSIKQEHTSKNTAKVVILTSNYDDNGEIKDKSKEIIHYLFQDDKYQKLKESNSTLYNDKDEIVEEKKTTYEYSKTDDGDEVEKSKDYKKEDGKWVKSMYRTITQKWVSENTFAVKEINGTTYTDEGNRTTSVKYEFDEYDKFHPSPMGPNYLGLGNIRMVAYTKMTQVHLKNGKRDNTLGEYTYNLKNTYNDNDFLTKSEYFNANRYEEIFEYY